MNNLLYPISYCHLFKQLFQVRQKRIPVNGLIQKNIDWKPNFVGDEVSILKYIMLMSRGDHK
jgi:hypothetical protein